MITDTNTDANTWIWITSIAKQHSALRTCTSIYTIQG